MAAVDSMNESIDILKKVLNNKLIFFIAKFPYFPSFDIKTVYGNTVESNIYRLHEHIIKIGDKNHNDLMKAMAAHTYGIQWYNQQIISMLNIGEAIKKLNNNCRTTQPIIIAFTNLITEMANRGMWVI